MISKPVKSPRVRGFLFTWNNYGVGPVDDNYGVESIQYLRNEVVPQVSYIIWGKEIGPVEGTPHLQGFVYFKTLKSCVQVHKIFPGCHITLVSVDNGCAKYSTKDQQYEEHGVRPLTEKEKKSKGGVSQKDKWDSIWDHAKAGDMELIPAQERIRCYRTLKQIRVDYMPPVSCVPVLDNSWIYGPSGSGKTSGVLADYPDIYLKNCNKWWDGYQGEETVLIDDMDESHHMFWHHLKIWGDHKPFLAETKGGTMKIRPKRIIVTSNVPLSVFCTKPAHLEALLRRYNEVEKSEVIQFQSDGTDAYIEIHQGPLN